MNGTGSCNEIKVERSATEIKGGRALLCCSQRRALGEGRIVVVVFYKLNKRREAPGGGQMECLKRRSELTYWELL